MCKYKKYDNTIIGDFMEFVYVSLRTVFIFILIIAIIRILGKREVGELSIFDLAVILIIADLGSFGIENAEKFIPSIICLGIILILQKLFSYLLVKKAKLRSLFDGSSKIIIFEGKLDLEAMKEEMYTVDDLITQMRNNNIMDIEEIKLAILETNGELSVFKKDDYPKIILPIIVSGEIVKESCRVFKLSEKDVTKMAFKSEVAVKDVFYAATDGVKLFVHQIGNYKKSKGKSKK